MLTSCASVVHEGYSFATPDEVWASTPQLYDIIAQLFISSLHPTTIIWQFLF